jgi:hypothetical protein
MTTSPQLAYQIGLAKLHDAYQATARRGLIGLLRRPRR